MKGYGRKIKLSEKKQAEISEALKELGILPKTGESKIGVTRKSHAQSKKSRKISEKSTRINRRRGQRVRR